MDKTHLDELIEYPNKAMQKICESKECIALLLNKSINSITDDDVDKALDEFIYDYQYIDDTTSESSAFIWVEADVPSVSNKHIKNTKIYITIACSKDYMALNRKTFPGMSGNRRDNITRYIDKIMNGSDVFGIGELRLNSVVTMNSSNPKFTARQLTYVVPDFNRKEGLGETRIC